MKVSQTAELGRLAIIGCGAVVEEFYMRKLNNLSEDGWTLLFVDADASRARELALRFRGAESLTSLDQVVVRASHAIVATPPASHYAICSALLGAGVHVLCEKPFVINPADGYNLVQQAVTSGLKLHVNQTRRWFPASLTIKKLVAEGALGELTTITIREGSRFNWPAKTAFHSQPNLTRHGILSDFGAHIFDLLAWMLNRPLNAIEVKHDGYAGPEATVYAKFLIGQVTCEAVITWLINVPPRIEFVGTKRQAIIDDDCNRALLQSNGEMRPLPSAKRYTTYQGIVADVIEAFLAGSDDVAVATAESVMPSIEFLDQAYTMAKAELPLVTTIGDTAL